MSSNREVFMPSAAVCMSWADATKSLEELIFEGVSKALAACGISMDDVDSVVLAAHDLVDGRSLSSMVTAPAAGAYLRDEIRLAEDGLSALSLAAARVASGESKCSVVAAWGRSSEGDHINVPRAAMDPFFEQPFGVTEETLSSMRLSRWISAYGHQKASRERAAAARSARASANPRAVGERGPKVSLPWPFEEFDSPRRADIVAATVLVPDKARFRIAGIGHSTDEARPGEREWLQRPALKQAVVRALESAGRSIDDMDAFEIDGFTLSDEVIAIEALELSKPGAGFGVYAASERINASGGSAAGWCYPAMGLVRLAELLHQFDRGARLGLAVAGSPIGMQTQAAVVVEAT